MKYEYVLTSVNTVLNSVTGISKNSLHSLPLDVDHVFWLLFLFLVDRLSNDRCKREIGNTKEWNECDKCDDIINRFTLWQTQFYSQVFYLNITTTQSYNHTFFSFLVSSFIYIKKKIIRWFQWMTFDFSFSFSFSFSSSGSDNIRLQKLEILTYQVHFINSIQSRRSLFLYQHIQTRT
jgi:hypothetical protein